jgi:hypothetical protein
VAALPASWPGPSSVQAIRGGVGALRYAKRLYQASRNPAEIADELVARGLVRDKADAERILAEMEGTLGQDMVPADLAGANTRGLAGTITRQPGEGRDPAVRFLRERQFGHDPDAPEAPIGSGTSQGERIDDALAGFGGRDRGTLATIDEVATRRKAEADPLYEAAHANSIDYESEAGKGLRQVLERIPEAAKKRANLILRNRGDASTQSVLLPLTPEELAQRAAEARRNAPAAEPKAAPAPVPTSDAPRETPIRRAPAGGKALSLKDYIAANGGLELNPDTVAADFHVVNVPGRGMLARKGGKSIDSFWRERLIEEGYLPPDEGGYASRDIRKELFDALDADVRHGEKTYPLSDQGVRAEQARSKVSGQDRETELAARAILKELRAAGIIQHNHEADTAALHDAADMLSRGQERDALSAYERAVMDAAKGEPLDRNVGLPPTSAYDEAVANAPGDMSEIWAETGKPGAEAFALRKLPNSRQWDLIRQALRDEATGASAVDPQTGRPNGLGSSYQALIRALDRNLNEAVPGLPEARAVYAGHSQLIDAATAGGKVWAPSMSREAVRREVSRLTPGEVEIYRLAAINKLREDTARMVDGADKARKVIGSKVVRDKLADLANGDAIEHRRLLAMLRNEQKMSETFASARGNSATAERMAEDASVDPDRLMHGAHAVANVAHGNYLAAIGNALRFMRGVADPELRGRVLEEARKVILNPDPEAFRAFTARMEASPLEQRDSRAIVTLVARALPRTIVNDGMSAKKQRERAPAR